MREKVMWKNEAVKWVFGSRGWHTTGVEQDSARQHRRVPSPTPCPRIPRSTCVGFQYDDTTCNQWDRASGCSMKLEILCTMLFRPWLYRNVVPCWWWALYCSLKSESLIFEIFIVQSIQFQWNIIMITLQYQGPRLPWSQRNPRQNIEGFWMKFIIHQLRWSKVVKDQISI